MQAFDKLRAEHTGPAQKALNEANAAFQQVSFRPHADGISDLPYSNKNDWLVLAWASCSVLAAQQSSSMQMTCAPKPW